ncbi:hypothetical protein [Nannocystis punicea]|uniref:Uncharacterized protein n=1 Tax=Nannocystis punicea TaxID=2995304 RepID=A0ABY7HBG5_9BACT|nr:hypothetical protein [Nannocystis poenicansa]WAS96452.1 hypothetical protein O0S08_09860 [Nannocystis poenicansa]
MHSSATRRLTASERAELEAERAQLVVAHAREVEVGRQLEARAFPVMLGSVGCCVLVAALLVYTGQLASAAMVGALAAWIVWVTVWGLPAPTSLLDVPEIARVDEALARDEVRVIDLRADAAVTVRAADGEVFGDLLRTGADQVSYLPRALCSSVDAERLPNTHLRIVCVQGLGSCHVEPLGIRLEPLADVVGAADNWRWCGDDAVIVWTPSEDRREGLHLCDGESYLASFAANIRELAAPLFAPAR